MIGGGILTFIGVVVMLYGILTNSRDKKTEKWNNTVGKIIDLKLSQTKSTDAGWDFVCHVKYSFLIDNKLIEGYKITNSIGFSSDENIKVYHKLKKAKSVKVYYNPKNHSQSCLVKGKTCLNSGVILIGTVVLIFGLCIFYLGFQDEKTQNDNSEIEFVKH